MKIEELVAAFGFEIDDKPLKDFEEGIKSITGGILGLGATVGASAFALFELAKSTAESRVEQMHLAQQTGLTIEQFSRLKFAAGMVDIGAEEMGFSLRILNKHLFDASKGGAEASKLFNKFGISQGSLRAVAFQTAPALQLIADKIAETPDLMKRSAMATEIFGRAGAKMLPILSKGAAGFEEYGKMAEELGLVLSDEKTEAAHKLMENFHLLSAVMLSIKNTVSGGLIPVMTDITREMGQWLMVNRQIIKQNLTGVVNALATYLKRTWHWVRLLANAAFDLTKVFGGMENTVSGLLSLLGVLSGISIIYGLGKVTMAVMAMAKAFKLAAFWESIAAVAPVLAWGTLAAAIILAMEDVYSFASGKDSITGMLLDKLTPDLAKIVGKFITFKEDIIKTMDDLWDYFAKKFPALGGVDNFMNNVGEASARVMGMHSGSVMDAFRRTPQTSPAAPGSFAVPATLPQVNAPITVNVPPGTAPGMVGDRVESGVQSGVENIFRQAKRASTSQVVN